MALATINTISYRTISQHSSSVAITMSRPRPDAELIAVAEKNMDIYYNKAAGWEDAVHIDNDKGTEEVLPNVQEAFDSTHKEVQQRYMGCGPLSIDLLEGMQVVDLGSGYARDTFAFAKLVGENGFVIGCDITKKENDFARKYLDWHRQAFNYKKSNVAIYDSSMTDLWACGVADKSIDLMISNGSVCMVPDTEAVYEEVSRSLKDGGELHYYSVFSDQRISYDIYHDSDIAGHALGCTYWRDQVDGLKERNMSTPRIVNFVRAWSKSDKAKEMVAGISYMYVSYRSFKLPADSPMEACKAVYNGKIPNCPEKLRFDYFTTFKKGEPMVIDGEMAAILKTSRYSKYFSFSAKTDGELVQTKNPVVNPFSLLK